MAAVIINRLMPDDADGAFVEARRRREAVQRQEIARAFCHLPRIDLPLLPDDVTASRRCATWDGS